jgi:hypothetical protein
MNDSENLIGWKTPTREVQSAANGAKQVRKGVNGE